MTLATHVIIASPMAPYREVFDFCRGLIGAEDSRFTDQPDETYIGKPTGMYSIANYLGQGYVAALRVQYHPDGPLTHPGEKAPDGFLRVTFDTGYAYHADNGANCSDLHAWLVECVAAWCDARGYGPVWWQDENTGMWFDSPTNLYELGDAERGALDKARAIG